MVLSETIDKLDIKLTIISLLSSDTDSWEDWLLHLLEIENDWQTEVFLLPPDESERKESFFQTQCAELL